MLEDLTTISVEKVVDSRGTLCPVPVLAASKAITGVSAGAVMEVQATGYLRLFIRKARE